MGLAQAALRPAAPVLAKLEDDPNPSYSYAYDVQDATTGDSKNHLENRNGNVVTGQYSLNDPDGTRRTVQYTADPINGFVAVVKKEPLVQAQLVTVPQQQAVFQQQQQPVAAPQEAYSLVQQPFSLVQERFYVAQPVVQQQAYVAQQPARYVQQQPAFVAQQPARFVQQQQAFVAQQPARLIQQQQQQPSRDAQRRMSQRQTAPEEAESTTVNSESEDIEPTTTEPTPESGYYYPKPASPAALFSRREPLTANKASAPKAQPEKLELFPEEPLAERVNPVAAPRTVQPVVAAEPVATQFVSSRYVQAPVLAFSSPYTFSTLTVF